MRKGTSNYVCKTHLGKSFKIFDCVVAILFRLDVFYDRNYHIYKVYETLVEDGVGSSS